MTGGAILRLILFVLPLGLDTFALATTLGITPMPLRHRLRLALTFAAAEGLMPAVGLLLGIPLGSALGTASDYLAGVLLIGLGFWMWYSERREDDDDKDDDKDDAREKSGEHARIARAASASGWAVLGLALSISLDELAVGFSFGVLGFPVLPALLAIAIQALLVSLVGQWLGQRLGDALGEAAEQLAGPVLALLGLWFILAHLFGLPM